MKSLTRGTIVNNTIKTSPVFIYFPFPDSLCFLYAILSILCIKKVQVCETTFTRTKPTTSCNVSIYYEYIWSSIWAYWNTNITYKPWKFFCCCCCYFLKKSARILLWIIMASLSYVCFVPAKGLIGDLSADSSNNAFEVSLAHIT